MPNRESANLFKAFTASLLVALSASVLLPPVASATGYRRPRAKRPATLETKHPQTLTLGMTEQEVVATVGHPDGWEDADGLGSRLLWYGGSYLTLTHGKLTGWEQSPDGAIFPTDEAKVAYGTALSWRDRRPETVRDAQILSHAFSGAADDGSSHASASASGSAPRDQYVRGYTRKDGTPVRPYYRGRR